MPLKALLGAMLVQVALTLFLLGLLGRSRVRSAAAGEVKIRDVALSGDAWPNRIRQIANAFNNQFELPVLFYVAALLAIATSQVDDLVVVLAWVFVLLRLVHAYIHVTSNHVIRRFQVYVAGFVALAALWGWLGFGLLVA